MHFPRSSYVLRVRTGREVGKVTYIELFFDLVFVFAITQLSHMLLAHLTPEGFWQAGLLLLATWWVWIYTSWVTNWLDPDRTPVRVMLLVLMLAGLVFSTSLPQAFGDRGLLVGGAYATMQVGRCLYMLWALKEHDPANYVNFIRITSWLAASAPFWIAGGLLEGPARIACWVVALLIEYASPAAGFWVPKLGRSTSEDWDVEGAHMAERCGLFIIIALGESILVTGGTFASLQWTSADLTAFVVAFLGSVAMWWIYFDSGAERGRRRIEHSGDPGAIARLAYTYIHTLIVAGIVVCAVADELILTHPIGHLDALGLAVVLGGPALFLVGNWLFHRAVAGRFPVSHLVGAAFLVALWPLQGVLTPLMLGTLSTFTLMAVGAWGSLWRPSPGRRPTPEPCDTMDLSDASGG
jgi:low temperature requirement protein LtrA